MKIGMIVGSLREASWNRKIAQEVKKLFSENFTVDFLEIKDLPLYSEDLDENPPESYQAFRKAVGSYDGFLFFTPEYNRSLPAPIKNALDIASRPYGQNQWQGRPVGVISVSIGASGAMAANHALRTPMIFLDMHPLQQPEVYLSNVQNYFDEQGLKDDTKQFLQSFVDAFETHAKRYAK